MIYLIHRIPRNVHLTDGLKYRNWLRAALTFLFTWFCDLWYIIIVRVLLPSIKKTDQIKIMIQWLGIDLITALCRPEATGIYRKNPTPKFFISYWISVSLQNFFKNHLKTDFRSDSESTPTHRFSLICRVSLSDNILIYRFFLLPREEVGWGEQFYILFRFKFGSIGFHNSSHFLSYRWRTGYSPKKQTQ